MFLSVSVSLSLGLSESKSGEVTPKTPNQPHLDHVVVVFVVGTTIIVDVEAFVPVVIKIGAHDDDETETTASSCVTSSTDMFDYNEDCFGATAAATTSRSRRDRS